MPFTLFMSIYLLLLVLMQTAGWLRAENEWEHRPARYDTHTQCISLLAFFLIRVH